MRRLILEVETLATSRQFKFSLTITRTNIQTRTFGERIVVASREAPESRIYIKAFNLVLNRAVNIIETCRHSTCTDRSDCTEMKSVALHSLKALNTREIRSIDISHVKSRCSELSLVILSLCEDLHHLEVIVAADKNEVTIILWELASAILNTILSQFVTDSELGGTIFTSKTDRSIALGI